MPSRIILIGVQFLYAPTSISGILGNCNHSAAFDLHSPTNISISTVCLWRSVPTRTVCSKHHALAVRGGKTHLGGVLGANPPLPLPPTRALASGIRQFLRLTKRKS